MRRASPAPGVAGGVVIAVAGMRSLIPPTERTRERADHVAVRCLRCCRLASSCGALVVARRPATRSGWLILAHRRSGARAACSGGYAGYALLAAPTCPAGQRWRPGSPRGCDVARALRRSCCWSWSFRRAAAVGAVRARAARACVVASIGRRCRGRPLGARPDGRVRPSCATPSPSTTAAPSCGRASTVAGAPSSPSPCCVRPRSIILRLRRARGVERQQLKWFAYATVLIAGWPRRSASWPLGARRHPGSALVAVVVALIRAPGRPSRSRSCGTGSTTSTVVINRTLVYGVAHRGCCVATYLVSVLLLQVVLRPADRRVRPGRGGLDAGGGGAVPAAAGGASRRVVDRRFYRQPVRRRPHPGGVRRPAAPASRPRRGRRRPARRRPRHRAARPRLPLAAEAGRR